MKRKSKRVIILCSLIVIISLSALVCFNSVDILFTVAGGLDEPSDSLYFTLGRIYKLSEGTDAGKVLLINYVEGKNFHLSNLYYRVLGAIGEQDTYYELRKRYNKIQHDRNAEGELFYLISSMGLLGNESIEPFLSLLLEKQSDLKVQVNGSLIASSLYLVTGKIDYIFLNSENHAQTLIMTDKLKKIRKVIIDSRGRDRTYGEMIILDGFFRK